MPTELFYHLLELEDNLERQMPPKIDVQSRKGHNDLMWIVKEGDVRVVDWTNMESVMDNHQDATKYLQHRLGMQGFLSS